MALGVVRNTPKLAGVGIMTPDALPKLRGKRFKSLSMLLQFGTPEQRVQVSLRNLSGTIDPQRGCVLSIHSQRVVKRGVRLAGVRTNSAELWPLVNKAVLCCALSIYIK